AAAAAANTDLDVLVPLGLLFGTAVDFQIDGFVTESDVRDLHLVADLGRRAGCLRELEKRRISRADRAVGGNHQVLGSYRDVFARVHELGIDHANELHPGVVVETLAALKIRRFKTWYGGLRFRFRRLHGGIY